jgi:hypothetical protein
MFNPKRLLTGPTTIVLLLLTLASCNEQEFYEKSYLEGAGVEQDNTADVPDDRQEIEDNDSDDSVDGPNIGMPIDDADSDADAGSDSDSDADAGSDSDSDADAGSDSDSDSDSDYTDGSGGDSDPDYTDGSGDDQVDDEEVPQIVYEPVSEEFTQSSEGNEKVDILWVVDDSGSMGDEQSALAFNFNAFILDFLNKDIDFQMGITTTDGTSRGDGKWRGHYKHLTSTAAAENEEKFLRDFKRTVKVGTRGSPREMGLHTGLRFLQRYADRKSVPFLRDDAYLVVVILSDEEDQSPKSVEHYVKELKNFKQQDGLFKLYSIVTKQKTGNRWESVGTKYINASQMSNGVSTDIKEDFYHILRNMGSSIVNLTKSFALSQSPHAGEIKVSVDGVVKEEGWSFDSETSSLRFNDDSLPRIGAKIVVEYKLEVQQ